jgi:hypothetical protein
MAATRLADEATADAFLRRQLVLTWVTGLVVLVSMAVVALAVFLLPTGSRAWVVAAALAGSAALTVLLVVLLRHAVGLARFAFRREVQ